ncbi:MAG: sortase [Candidatus Saccharimonadales bacterium]
MRINRKQWMLIRIYVVLFAGMFLAINWSWASWMFNYREVTGLMDGFFNPYPESPLLAGTSNTASSGIQLNTAQAATESPSPIVSASADNSLSIPAIGLNTAVVIGQTTDSVILENDLNDGVVYYPGSVLPGQPGEIVVLGHSAPPGWPHERHDWVFSNISDLKAGDTVTLNFNGHQYHYAVKDQGIIQQGQDVKATDFNGKNNVLELVSCWPPGKNYKRIVVQAILQS